MRRKKEKDVKGVGEEEWIMLPTLVQVKSSA